MVNVILQMMNNLYEAIADQNKAAFRYTVTEL